MDLILGKDLAGLTLAYKSKSRLNTIITSAALSPTGAFKHASLFFIFSRVKSGKALPNLDKA